MPCRLSHFCFWALLRHADHAARCPLLRKERKSLFLAVRAAFVKVCGWRPHDGGAADTWGRRTQTSKGGNRGRCDEACASDAMGIWTLAACCRGALIASLGSSRRGGEHCRPIATGRTGVAQQRSNDRTAVPGFARASLIIAGQEAAIQKGRAGVSPRIDFDHDVSILITAVDAAGR